MLACGASSDESGGESSSGAPTSSSSSSSGSARTDGGTSSGSSGAPDAANAGPALPGSFRLCPAYECKAAVSQPWADCALAACAVPFDKYKKACAAGVACFAKCACGDEACFTQCKASETAAACSDAKDAADSCSFTKCPIAIACGGSTKTCAELSTCCNKIADAALKQACRDTAATKSNIACGNDYLSYAADCP
jgi:hypothetical protein